MRALRNDPRLAAHVEDKAVRLSPLEYRFLEYLSHHPGRVVAAHAIAEHLYGAADGDDTNAIEALVTRLRRKVGPGVVETRRGFGYTLAEGRA